MSHIFQCQTQDHYIIDISEEPVPHIGEVESIFCPECEHDVQGTYVGQANNQSFKSINTTVDEKQFTIYTGRQSSPYCIRCDGACQL